MAQEGDDVGHLEWPVHVHVDEQWGPQDSSQWWIARNANEWEDYFPGVVTEYPDWSQWWISFRAQEGTDWAPWGRENADTSWRFPPNLMQEGDDDPRPLGMLEILDKGLQYLAGNATFRMFCKVPIELETTVVYGSTVPLEQEWTIEYKISGTLEREFTVRYSNLEALEQETNIRYTVFPHAVRSADPTYSSPAYIAEGGPPAPLVSPWAQAWKFNESTLTASFAVYGTKIGLAGTREDIVGCDMQTLPNEFTTTWGESSQTSWTLDITDKTGYYHPLNEASPWYGVMNEECISGNAVNQTKVYGMNLTDVTRIIYDNIPSKLLNVATEWGGLSFHFTGLGNSYAIRRDDQNLVYGIQWKGYDKALTLFSEDQTMGTVRQRMSQDVISEICAAYGVTVNFAYLPDNFMIRVMHRQKGRPIDWIMQILACSVAEWTMTDGTVFTPYLPTLGLSPGLQSGFASWGKPSPRYIYDLSSTCINEQVLEHSASRLINDVVAIMAIEGGATATPRMAVTDFHDYTLEFPVVMSGVSWRIISQQGGRFSDFIFRDEGGQVIAVRAPREDYFDVGGGILHGSSPAGGPYAEWKLVNGGVMRAKSVTFTWGNLPTDNQALGGFGEIAFYGTDMKGVAVGEDPFGPNGAGNHLDPYPGLRARSRNLESVLRHGIRTLELQANSLIWDRKWLQLYADRTLMKFSRGNSAAYNVPYNPDIKPGTVIREVNPELHYSLIRVVTSAQHRVSNSVVQRGTQYTGFSCKPFTLQHIGPSGLVTETIAP